MNNDKITPNCLATLCLCTTLGIPHKADDGYKPLTQGEWNRLALALSHSSLKEPGGLLEAQAGSWEKELGLNPYQLERMKKLLSRIGNLVVEVERLESLGIWVITRGDKSYPDRLKRKLKERAPIVLYGAGNQKLFTTGSVALVGSRDVDSDGVTFTERLARKCTNDGVTVISGGARGVDQIAQNTAASLGGKCIVVLADSLEASLRRQHIRDSVLNGNLLVVTSFHPKSPFSVAKAMARNAYVYSLADYAVVVSASLSQGGTWAGATDDLKNRWSPLFVRDTESLPGNQRLLAMGALPIDLETVQSNQNLVALMEEKSRQGYVPAAKEQLSMFEK